MNKVIIDLESYDNLKERVFTLNKDNIDLRYEKDLMNEELNELRQEKVNLIYELFKEKARLSEYTLKDGQLVYEYSWLEKELEEFNDKYKLPENTIKIMLMTELRGKENE